MDRARADTPSEIDLSALAWVHDELRRSLETAHKGLRRFVKEYQTVFDSDVDAVDPAVLRDAHRQHGGEDEDRLLQHDGTLLQKGRRNSERLEF